MPRDPRYDILFEPVKIGPKTARNRFYQVPHCTGMGHVRPRAEAAMRGVKAEGGWAVVSTQECDIHPTSDILPFPEGRLWDDRDLPGLALMAESVHRHGALAAIELTHHGPTTANYYSRETPIGPGHEPIAWDAPVQARAMDKADIRDYRRWHRAAALRARTAGFDIVYCYAGHNIALPMHFLQKRRNQRTDEYGGSLENRARLLRELIEDTKEAVGDSCAVALRFAVDELLGEDGITSGSEGREVVAMLAELPDLWDVNVSDWHNDSVTSRFADEGYQEKHIAFVKTLTTKPVVGVGRFTSPDAMVSQIRRGILDMIGAARPSIADPFLPKKIEEGRLDDIRECIGCNICVSGDYTMTPMRCTQNPTMGEEWRRGWHPEIIAGKGSDASVLIVGAGPAGLECARALGQRGYAVHLAEAGEELGGRVSRESRLPGLAAWARVRDHRLLQLDKMANVSLYRASRLEAADVREMGAAHVVIGTGATWRRDGVGRARRTTIPGFTGPGVYTPDDVMAGVTIAGPVVVFDDDHYYIGGVLAEKLRQLGLAVTLVTPAESASHWTHNTLEHERIQTRLLELGVELVANRAVTAFRGDHVTTACVYTQRRRDIPCRAVVTVTARLPDDALRRSLEADAPALAAAGIKSVTAIGDAFAPATIAHAVHAGHRYARELDAAIDRDRPFARELPAAVDL
ncbi:MAG TPA: FAD-dependent oxidoreductase [Candidatus Acidoferrum sp.]|nr:FAD-dependent oxidoreductase [Candidatus Acidoferrum sp.]